MLSPLEVAAGVPLPTRAKSVPLPHTTRRPREVLEETLLPALRSAPCVVSFSGGRDSSLVLASAVATARREGLPLPIPVTVRVRGDSDSDERAWQELVIEHLGVTEWVRVDIGDELDCIGPVAQGVLRRHGVLWPTNVHFHTPQLEAATGGSVLTGIGGDEVFSRSGWARLRSVLAGRAVPEPRDVLRLAAALAPRGLRRRVLLRRTDVELDWLRPDARNEIVNALADEAVAEPLTWGRRLRWLLGLSYLEHGTRSLNVLAADWDATVHHPLLDRGFVGSLAALPRSRRFDGRTEALTSLFGDLLPSRVWARTSKAAFGGPLWGPASQTFAEGWDGSGVDPDLVDADALMRRWRDDRKPGPHTLLQSLWLARAGAAQEAASSSRSSASGIASHERGRESSQAGSVLS